MDSIVTTYNELYRQQPFNIEYLDKSFNTVSLEVLKNGVRYIKNYDLHTSNFTDSLKRYGFNLADFYNLLTQMGSVRCLWIGNIMYYENAVPKRLTLVSLRRRKINSLFKPIQFYSLAYFAEPQIFNDSGFLLDKSELPQKNNLAKRKIISHFFKRVTDSVCYTISERFR